MSSVWSCELEDTGELSGVRWQPRDRPAFQGEKMLESKSTVRKLCGSIEGCSDHTPILPATERLHTSPGKVTKTDDDNAADRASCESPAKDQNVINPLS